MSRHGAGLLVLMAGATAGPAWAQGLDVSATATVTSDYRFRGISQSNRDPALQATFDLQAPDGLFGGVFASTIDGAAFGGADGEIDLYGGYAAHHGDLSYSISGFGYFYPGGRDANYGEVQGEIGYLIGPVQAKAFAAYAPDQRTIGGDNRYFGGSVNSGIPRTPLSITLSGGHEDGGYGGKWDWRADLSWAHGPLTVSAAYVDTSLSAASPDARLGGAGAIGSLAVAF
jgi:uncharacterized protein (TIGR02001 family)